MNHKVEPRPFPIPVVAALGPGSQQEDETLDYITMPSGMHTYQPPSLPEPEQLAGHGGALRVLHAALDALRCAVAGQATAPVLLQGLSQAELALVHQVLGEGEVSAQVLPLPGLGAGQGHAEVQESVFAGVWRVLEVAADGAVRDSIQVGAVPALLQAAAQQDADGPRPDLLAAPPGIMNAVPVLAELADQRQQWRAGQPAQVVNLTLLPLTPEDIGYMDHQLGTGRVLILSRGYGNCRISNCQVANTWRVVYYNSQDHVILNSVEVTALPEVACAAPEDLADSLERLREVLDWVAQG